MPLLFAKINTHLGKVKLEPAKVLCDSVSSATIISKSLASRLRKKSGTTTVWHTKVEVFKKTKKAVVQFQLLKLNQDKVIKWTMHVDPQDELSCI